MARLHPSSLVASTALLLAACGPASPPPAEAPAKAAAASTAAPAPSAAPTAEPEAKPLPTSCETKTDKWCLPPADFVKRLCAGSFPNVALVLFAKGTPWSRAYLRMKSVDAWSASGARPSSEKIVYEEEMLVLASRKAAPSGMSVSGAGDSIDVLRWDGTCASLMEEEVTTRMYSVPKHAKVPWKLLDDAIQNAILSDEKAAKVLADRTRECKGTAPGDGNAKCDKADAKLNDMVVDYVRNGGAIPPPARLP